MRYLNGERRQCRAPRPNRAVVTATASAAGAPRRTGTTTIGLEEHFSLKTPPWSPLPRTSFGNPLRVHPPETPSVNSQAVPFPAETSLRESLLGSAFSKGLACVPSVTARILFPNPGCLHWKKKGRLIRILLVESKAKEFAYNTAELVPTEWVRKLLEKTGHIESPKLRLFIAQLSEPRLCDARVGVDGTVVKRLPESRSGYPRCDGEDTGHRLSAIGSWHHWLGLLFAILESSETLLG